jgi:hypothetical protein
MDTWRQFCGKIEPADVTLNTQDIIAADVMRPVGVIDKVRAWDVAGAMPKAALNRASCQTGLAWLTVIRRSPTRNIQNFCCATKPPERKNEEPDRDCGLGRVLPRRRAGFGRRIAQ